MIGPFVIPLLLFIATLIFFSWKTIQQRRKLPPGPFRWPILGCIPQMMQIDKEYPFRQIMGLSAIYGDIMSIGLGVNYAVVISKFEIMKDLLKRPEFTLQRYKSLFTEQRTHGKNLGIVWTDDDVWVDVRRFTVRKLGDFGFAKKGNDETIKEEMDFLMNDIRHSSENTDGVWALDLGRFGIAAINIVWSSVGGYRFDPDSEFIKRHVDVNKEVCEILRPTNLLTAFPFLKIFPEMSGYSRETEISKTCWKVMEDLVQDAKVKRLARDDQKAQSFVEVFLDKIEKNRGNHNTNMTEEQLIAVLMDLFLVGTETTSTVMAWTVIYLTLFPEVQNRAREEILNVSENGSKYIPLTATNKMPYTVAVLLEVMRHCPFATIPPPRQTTCDIEYDNYVIPKGTCILYNLRPVMFDSAYWGDPEQFRPERFFNPDGMTLNSEKMERASCFGFGKRVCPGEAMAMDVLFRFMISLLLTFSLEVKEGQEPTLEPGIAAITILPRPCVVKFVPRA